MIRHILALVTCAAFATCDSFTASIGTSFPGGSVKMTSDGKTINTHLDLDGKSIIKLNK